MSVEEALSGESGHAALSLLGKLVPAHLYLFDLRRLELVWSSRPLQEVLELDAEQVAEIARTGVASVLHPADLARLPDLRARHAMLADGELLEGDFRFRGKDGSWQWLHTREVVAERDAEGRPTRLLGSAQNVTQARRLAEQRALLHAAVQQIDETIVVTTPDGVVVYVNPAFERVTGHRRDEVIGRHVRVLTSGEHDRDFYRRLWEVLLRGDTWRGTFVNRRKDGTKFREEATISPVRDQAGTVTHFIAVKRDLSREERLTAQLAKARGPGVAERLTALVAHELDAPERRSPSSERIWIVEDDPQVRALAVRALRALGYHASAFESAQAVLAAARLARLPDLVICDLGLAAGDGIELAQAIRARCPGQRILFVSGHQPSHAPLPAGARFLAKPFSLDDLADAARACLDGREDDAREASERRLALAGE